MTEHILRRPIVERPEGAFAFGRRCAGGAAGFLSWAAAPTFAMMALLNGVLGGTDMLCATVHDASPLGGMVPMYWLMSAFHLSPWLKWISRRGGGSPTGGLNHESRHTCHSRLSASGGKIVS